MAAESVAEEGRSPRVLPELPLLAGTLGDPLCTSNHFAVVAFPSDPLALARSRERPPSSELYEQSLPGPARSGCERSSRQAADAPPAVRRLLTLAQRLLDADRDECVHHSMAVASTPLQRVALLRDELHVTANRVARFGVDEHPIVDPVRIAAPTAASAVLAPGRLLFQLDLAADRLIALLEPLTPRDWSCTCRMGDRIVTLGELVDGALDEAAHDLLDLLHAVTGHASQETDGVFDG